jgi:hypothetical protein
MTRSSLADAPPRRAAGKMTRPSSPDRTKEPLWIAIAVVHREVRMGTSIAVSDMTTRHDKLRLLRDAYHPREICLMGLRESHPPLVALRVQLSRSVHHAAD